MAKTACALHILVDNEKLTNVLLVELKRDVSFDTLARKYSGCPSKRHGGSLGEFIKSSMGAAFDKAVFSIPLLKPHGSVKTQFGYHIIKVLYRSGGGRNLPPPSRLPCAKIHRFRHHKTL
ncbi:peptidyl-prolyl cis-trans isomerase [Serratia symbiotica]|uniref:Peptidyl-prolyl cis-trans isomerase C n=1 Tax=Serratia symbiotica TaxID=138074 RepID=A0A7D5T8Y0_9GAMM|nr:peptidyl-prolyl cis-trans isomerase [Serratia symbiotica]